MNRQERRRKLFKKSDRTYQMKDFEIKKIKDDAVIVGFEMSIAVPMMVLRDKYGFGKKRLHDFYDHVTSQWAAIQRDDNEVEIEDMRKALFEEVGLKFEYTDGKR